MTMNDNWSIHLGPLTLNGGELSSGGYSTDTWGSYYMEGNVTVKAGTSTISAVRITGNAVHTFDVEAGGTLNVTGSFSNVYGSFGLTKTGNGKLMLSSTNTYTGATTVNGGVLAVDGSLAAGNSVAVGGATATGSPILTGIGTVNGAVTINSASGGAAGTINPGAVGSIGTLNTGATTINGTLAIDLNATAADKLVVNGNLDLTGSTLAVNALATPAAPPSTIASYTGTLTGTLGSPPSGYSVNYVSGSPNTITLTKATSDYNTWGLPYGLTTGSEGGDLDGDGLTNFQEYAFGLIPNSGASCNPITSPLSKATKKFSFTRRATPTSTGLTYSVWFSTDLIGWTQDTGATEATPVLNGEVETVEVTLSALPGDPLPAKLFIQVRAK